MKILITDSTLVERLPWKRWGFLSGIAIGGSCLYGASLATPFPQWTFGSGAAWLALSGGLSWCVFIPALKRWTRVDSVSLIDACLVTMAWGEGVLLLGVWVNLFGPHLLYYWVMAVNVGILAVSNVVMAGVLSTLLRRHGVPIRRTVGLWILVLNGSGILFFLLFYRWLVGPGA